jgi:preprotein translocase SecE subunit
MNEYRRYIVLFLTLSAALIAFVLDRAFNGLFGLLHIQNAALLGQNLTVGRLAAIVVAGGLAFALDRNPTASVLANDIATEIGKITWPPREETTNSTRIVVVAVVVFSAVFFLFDYLGATFTSYVY